MHGQVDGRNDKPIFLALDKSINLVEDYFGDFWVTRAAKQVHFTLQNANALLIRLPSLGDSPNSKIADSSTINLLKIYAVLSDRLVSIGNTRMPYKAESSLAGQLIRRQS